jgi:D-ribose pyranose/furanose isomerase RbsD
MMQRQKVINNMVGSLGDRIEFMDNREVADAGLSQAEQTQLTKMSLSKIVGNLRNKLKEEEKRIQSLNIKLD